MCNKYYKTENYKLKRKNYYSSKKGKSIRKNNNQNMYKNLKSCYIAIRLGSHVKDLTPELIELKRTQLMIKRELKAAN